MGEKICYGLTRRDQFDEAARGGIRKFLLETSSGSFPTSSMHGVIIDKSIFHFITGTKKS